jgi:hypothetical protein
LPAEPSPAANANLFANNPGFEGSTEDVDNLWDGVNSDGTLAGFTFSASIVADNGKFSGVAMPPSVAFIDANGDGKPDLVTADPSGFFRFYPNSGTPAAPKFTSAEIIPLFVSLAPAPSLNDLGYNGRRDGFRFCPRFALADWRHSGLLDFLIGDYFGDVFFIPNTGTARQPVYRPKGGTETDPETTNEAERKRTAARGAGADSEVAEPGVIPDRPPTSVEASRIPTNDQGRYWANLISPVAYDWTGHGKLDMLCGEGTYSANAIHLLENTGTDKPQFTSAHHTIIAYGDGREQLIPAVADLNGDGLPDLVVADRTGEVGLYLSTAKPAPGLELKRASTLTFGGVSKLPGLCSVYAADYNGDGLIDLIIGLPSGHIAVSLNTGTKTQPSFGPIQEIKGVDRLGRDIHKPSGWTTETSNHYGNALSYFTVVSGQDDPASQPPEGAHCLKAGYWPSPGATFAMPAEGIPGTFKHFILLYKGLTLDINKSYKVSFKAKGQGMEKMHWEFESRFVGYPDPVVDKNERGGVKDASARVYEWVRLGSNFSASSNWSEVDGTITPRYKAASLRDRKQMTGTFVLDFWAQNMSSVMYLDDFHIALNQ